ncbi:MAG: Rne/Rng family ribonuclease [Rhizomicrobium sp.]|nr:Rne/Rng family ribonuclease [Rhizomicrobium sp.]
MAQEIRINVSVGEVRVAVVENRRLEALSCTRLLGSEESSGHLGNIILGRVVRVVPAVQAAFVEIGRERAGFLGAREARCLVPENNTDGAPELSISQLVREGDCVLVQVAKDPIGDKGARLTANVTLPGRLCVFTPLQPGLGISRRIEDEGERQRLAAIGETLFASGEFKGGCILRTAAVGASEEELREDLLRLEEMWGEISAAKKRAAIPSILYRDLGPIERALRDIVHDTTAAIVIDNAKAAATARTYCREAIPEVVDRITVHAEATPLFDDLEADIEALIHSRVPLDCGGWLTVEGTEALTAIDVNSGSFTHSSAVEDTGLAVNLEAATEIGRQLRLRGIGGLIVIDFIHMKEPVHYERILAALSLSLARDGVPVNIGKVTDFGLVEVTRKRVREPLVSLWSEDCLSCRGLGIVRRADAVAMDLLRRVEETARAAPGKAIVVTASQSVLRWLKHEQALEALAAIGVGRITLSENGALAGERFEVGTDG